MQQAANTSPQGHGKAKDAGLGIAMNDARMMQAANDRKNPDRFFAREGVDPLPHAFAGKIAVHPGMGGIPVPADQKDALLETLLAQGRTGKTVAYINVPFCETHCLYCGFYKAGYRKEQSREYADALVRELDLWRDRRAVQEGPVHTVYFGGGTPTALEPADLKRILLAVRGALPLANDCEITIEGRCSNLDQARIEACLEGGANRFSLGVQSFNTQIRQAMGRRSTKEQLMERLSLLLSYNQAAVIIDLIYGFPMQTMDIWLQDIADAHSLDLDGADCYQLNIYKKSLLAGAIERGKLPQGADIPAQSAMFRAGVKAMEDGFYRRLSISHWARTPRERNLYNQYVKGGANCLAFGPGAGGSLHGHFFFTNPSYEAWKDSVSRGEKPVMMLQRPGETAALFRSMAEDMEQARLDLPRLERTHGYPLTDILRPVLDQWERVGLVTSRGDSKVLTLAGQFWQVNLSQLLMEYCTEQLARRAAQAELSP